MLRKSKQDLHPDLFDSPGQLDVFLDPGFPPHVRFPYNYRAKRVGSLVEPDLLDSPAPLLITGYTSLDQIVSFLSACYERTNDTPDAFRSIRVLLGHEPNALAKDRIRLGDHALSEEIASYWLREGISIHLCGDVLSAIELLQGDRVKVRTSRDRPVHAKIYKGESAVTIGSSNYSYAGLRGQIESNCRFSRADEEVRFKEAGELAEAIWTLGIDYKAELIRLLRRLLRSVTWAEALARACAELLEGKWAQRYVAPHAYGEVRLWPSQEQGVAQAMWVLENIGSVLVADATGSGKTRMGSHLIRALQDRNWRTGRMRRDLPVMICPPNVAESWQREGRLCGQEIPTISHGILSHPASLHHSEAIQVLRRAQVLAVDETHNFLNRLTARTQRLYGNMADHVVLFSATPINRGAQDLLAIIDLLGADNFDDEVLRVLQRIARRRSHRGERLAPDEREVIRRAIQRFIVRRTKSMFNRLIDEEPERYTNALEQQCRYPKHVPLTYTCGETTRDRELAQTIRDAAGRLRGLTNLRKTLQLPEYLRLEGWDDEKYLNMRLRAAKALAAYRIGACLRSSRAALLEHLYGTTAAQELCGILGRIKSEDTGNVIESLRGMRGRPPINELKVPLPEWLADVGEHARVCDEEIAIYEQMGALTQELSTAREEAKAQHLGALLKKHDLVLAFDSRLITLSDIKARLERRGSGKVLLATGQSQPRRVHQAFALGSRERGVVALCSDVLSEGVNLQAASALVLLDMPSVIRVAEQRIGRVDRMDSPHAEIEVYWPDDAPEFALRSDEVFRERHRDVAELIGSNLELPPSLRSEHGVASRAVSWKEVAAGVKEMEREDESWNGLEDAFAPVRAMVEGENVLVPAPVYASMRRTDARVYSSVSVVESKLEWTFLAIAGNEDGAPRWIYFDEESTHPLTDLDAISRRLREHLSDHIVDRKLDKQATERLKRDLTRLHEWEMQLLPRKKRRALEEMRRVLASYERQALVSEDMARARLIQAILALTKRNTDAEDPERPAVDLSILAEWWLDLIRPVWYEHLSHRRRNKPALLRNIRADLERDPITTERLQSIRVIPLRSKPMDQRVVAAIVGITGVNLRPESAPPTGMRTDFAGAHGH